MSDPRENFVGAKVMVFLGPDLLVLRRDHTPGIDWPGRLDFPGGGREGDESPETCVLRETREEVGLRLEREALEVVHLRRSRRGLAWFFATHLPSAAVRDVVFGGEGAGWRVMTPGEYLVDADAIPPFRHILAAYLEDKGRGA